MIEQLYNDFSTKLLPKISEGLSMTYDYFLNLFGRYIKYLIITDAIYSVIWLVVFLTSVFYFRKSLKTLFSIDSYREEGRFAFWITIGCLTFISGLMSFFAVLEYTEDVIKDIYIPEIRIYEEIKSFTDKPSTTAE